MKAHRRRILTWLAVLLLAWPTLVVLVATPTLEALLPKLYRDQTGRELRFGDVALNPFTLTLTLGDAASPDPDGRDLWALRELEIDVSVASLWRRALVLDLLRVDGLSLRVEQLDAEHYNFSDIVDFRARHFPATDTSDDSALPPLQLERVEFGLTRLDLRLPHITEPLTADLRELHLTLDEFTTRPDGYSLEPSSDAAGGDLPALASGPLQFGFEQLQLQSLRDEEPWDSTVRDFSFGLEQLTTVAVAGQPYQLAADFAEGGSLRWSGDLALAASRSSGEIALQGVGLEPLWRYLQPQLNFRALTSAPPGHNRLDLSARYRIDWGDQLAWALEAGTLALHDTRLQARNDKETTLQLQRLGLDGISADSATRQLTIGQMAVDGLALKSWNRDTSVGLVEMLRPRQPTQPTAASATPSTTAPTDTSTPWQLVVGELTGDDARIRWQASQLDVDQIDIHPLQFRLQQLRWPSTGPAQISASARVNDTLQLAAEGELDPGTLNGELRGTVDGLPLAWGNKLLGQQLALTIDDGALATQWQLALADGAPTRIKADGSVAGFELRRSGNKRPLASWQLMKWQQLEIDLTENRLTLAEVGLQQPYLQFRLYEDRTTNFRNLTVAQSPSSTGEQSDATQASDAKGVEAESKKNAETNDSAETKPLQVAVTAVRIADGKLNFRDDTLPRPFRANIGELSGDILDLSSERGRSASIDLTGSVDGYAPVTLVGRAAPLAEPPSLDLTLNFNNLDLATFTPYSSTYAGYTIDRGQLSVQLAYTLEQNRIKGRNRVVVDQLQLGERVESAKALDIPLRLVIALLTNSKGVMDLGVDISGNIDDPKFDLGGIVWKAFRNVLTKAATSPFRLLAGLAGTDEKLAFIVFEPGSDALNERAREKLTALRQALNKRTDLRLLVSGQTDDAADSVALREQQRDELLLEAGLSETALAERGRAWRSALLDLYEQQLPDGDPDPLSDAQLADAVRDSVTLRPTALSALAGRRAQTVKRALVTEYSLPAERVFIDIGKRQTLQMARATMKLDVR